MLTPKRIAGNDAEHFVATRLEQEGFILLERNYQKPYGEIDLIARKADVIAFVEVKMRRSHTGLIHGVVNQTKQRKIALVAKEYIARHHIGNSVYRFDVAFVFIDQENRLQLEYIANAFQV